MKTPRKEPGNRDHALTLPMEEGTGVGGPRILILVRGGAQAYLWIGGAGDSGRCYGTVGRAATLRRLARAILKEVPPEEPARKARAGK